NCRLGTEDPNAPAPSPEFCQSIYDLLTRTTAPGTTLDGRLERINQAYINTSKQNIAGVDTNFRYRRMTDRWGTFRFEGSWAYNIHNKYQQLPEDDLVDYRNIQPSLNFFYPERSRVRATASW